MIVLVISEIWCDKSAFSSCRLQHVLSWWWESSRCKRLISFYNVYVCTHRVQMNLNMMTSCYGNAFRTASGIPGIHQWLIDSPQKGSVMRCFILFHLSLNIFWTNSRGTSSLRRRDAHVTSLSWIIHFCQQKVIWNHWYVETLWRKNNIAGITSFLPYLGRVMCKFGSR